METFQEYEAVVEQTAIYPGRHGDTIAYYPVLGLTGEAGEVAEKYKKILRDKDGYVSIEDGKEILKELGDVLWYITAIAGELNYDLQHVAEANAEKLLSRLERNVLSGSGDNR